MGKTNQKRRGGGGGGGSGKFINRKDLTISYLNRSM